MWLTFAHFCRITINPKIWQVFPKALEHNHARFHESRMQTSHIILFMDTQTLDRRNKMLAICTEKLWLITPHVVCKGASGPG